VAEALPIRDDGADLVWCREMICVVDALDAVFAECRRVLRPGGLMLIYCNFVTDPRGLSASWYRSLGMVPARAEAGNVEAAALHRGFRIERSLALGSETGEYAQETTGEPGRRLLHAARLLRDPDRYIARFGRANYETMLSDCLWHVYRMIGKLGLHIYLLRRV
jgi:SAM-dependent methyltransferase